jgi:hypothetical protein
MILIQLIIDLFLVFFIVNLIIKVKREQIGPAAFIFWLIFWLAGLSIINWPDSTGFLARILGVGRGADVIIYFSIILIFNFIFYYTLQLRKIEREITAIVRKIAFIEKDKEVAEH